LHDPNHPDADRAAGAPAAPWSPPRSRWITARPFSSRAARPAAATGGPVAVGAHRATSRVEGCWRV